jgi:hypothetical protein
MFVVDADILIRAKNTYFQFERVPPFWTWLVHHAEAGNICIPIETWVKIGDKTADQRDDLALWAIEHKDVLVPEDRSYDALFGRVYSKYAWPDGSATTEADLIKIGDDYALIACALHNGFTVVTNEVRENKVGPNKKVPNVCDDLGVGCIDLDGTSG